MTQPRISKTASESWENEGGSIGPSSYAESMGVKRVLIETFRVGGRSYTSLADAVAQARRLHEPRAGL